MVEVFASYMTGIDWLAGRGYNVLGVRVPVLFEGREDRAAGPFLMVLWENLADPILTGREQLGFSKIWCELPEPVEFGGETRCSASWLGFRFLDVTLRGMEEADPGTAVPTSVSRGDNALTGMLHYKYVPKTGAWGEADAAYAVLSPGHRSPSAARGVLPGARARSSSTGARWEDLPTQYMIVNALHELSVKEYRGATIQRRVGGGDLIGQRIVA